jgi:hypothetical protein
MAKQVKCIRKRDHYNAHERIAAIGGMNWDGTRWLMTEDEAIRAIERRTEEFYVSVNGTTVEVVVSTHSGRKYLKTAPDGYSPDNLLALPDCP